MIVEAKEIMYLEINVKIPRFRLFSFKVKPSSYEIFNLLYTYYSEIFNPFRNLIITSLT